MPASLGFFLQQLGPAGFGHIFVVKWAVYAPITTTAATIEVVLFGEDNVALLVVVVVFAFFQVQFHGGRRVVGLIRYPMVARFA